jgi:hypothetical protein
MVASRQERSEIEGESGWARDHDSISAPIQIGRPYGGRLVKDDATNKLEVNTVWHGELNRLGSGHPSQAVELATGRSGHEPARMTEADSHAPTLQCVRS